MVLLIDPDQEVLVIIVPDAAGVRPVASHSRCQEEGRDGFVEQEVVLDKQKKTPLDPSHFGHKVHRPRW